MRVLLVLLFLACSASQAFAWGTGDQFLIEPDLATAQTRSAQQCQAKGCQVPTLYWWTVVENATTGQAALAIRASGDFGSTGLTAGELAALVPYAQMDASWFPKAQ